MGLFNKQQTTNRKGLFSTPASDNYDTSSVQRQLDNARLRIQDAGFNPLEDNRNWFEKATNLPKNQNFFMDTLDLLSRPGKAILNTIDKVPDGEEGTAEALWRGFSGKDKVTGSDIVEKAGIDNKLGKFALGTGLEILTDPLNLIPGTAIAKGFSKVGKGVKTGYNATENVLPVLGKAREKITPVTQGTKDALGNMFKYQYNWDKTLTGEADDTLKGLFNKTRNDIRYMNENSLKNVANTANKTGVDAGPQVGRIMEKDLKQFDEQGNLLSRPTREMPTDTKIQQAAEQLMTSNNVLRQWALDNGIEIKELEGYMKHILSAEERARRKTKKSLSLDKGNFGVGQPNKKVLNPRKYKGSVEDINEEFGEKVFEPNAYFSTAIGQKQLIEYVNAVKFRREILSNPKFAVKAEKGMNYDLPPGVTKIDVNNYKFMKDELADELGLADEIGGEYIVTKGVKEALDRYQKMTTDEGVKGFLKAFDTAQSWWKRSALFSFPYHLRNEVGAMFNNYVGGMSVKDLTRYSKEANKDVYNAIIKGKESDLYKEYSQQGLSSSNLSQVEFARYGEEPEKAIERTIKKRSQFDGTLKGRLKTEAKQLKNPFNAFETSREFGDFIDQTNRFALYKWARDKGMSPQQAAEKVREVQFDYNRLTNFEREFMTRAVPFYRWMRNNIPFQLRSFINNPQKYMHVNKVRTNAQSAVGIDDENVPEYMKQNFAIPVAGDGKGSGKFLSLNLPLSDIDRIASPLKTMIDSATPLAKLPLELGINRNLFFNKPIENFENQQKLFQISDKQFGIPIKTAYALEQATGQIGRGLSGFLQKPKTADQDIKFRMPSLGISSVFKDYDVDRTKFYETLDKLRRLQDQIDYIEQQTGKRPRSVNEIR